MLGSRDFLLRARLDAASLEAWIEAGWLVPKRAGPERVFSELDLARAWLIRDMRDSMGSTCRSKIGARRRAGGIVKVTAATGLWPNVGC